MAYWCENTLFVSSNNEEQLKDFMEKVKDPEKNTDLSLQKLFPCPDELLELDLPNRNSSDEECEKLIMNYGHAVRYDWVISNWGTKWDVRAKLIDDGGYYAGYLFESAWTPPVQWIIAAALKYPELHFELKYDEPGMGFMGVCTAHGEEISDQCIEY